MMENEDPSAWKGRVSPNDFPISSASDQIGGARPQETLISQEANSSVQSAANAADAERRSDAEQESKNEDSCEHGKNGSVVKRGRPKRNRAQGRKRRGYSMGRYPFLTYAEKYLQEYKTYLAENTWNVQERALRLFAKVFEELKIQAQVDTTNPTKFTEKEIAAFLRWMKERNLEVNAQVKYLQILNALLRYCSNSIIDVMRSRKLLPKPVAKEIKSLNEMEIQQIIDSAGRLKGWKGVVAKFICTFYPYTGLRPSELRLAQRADLDENTWLFWVRHPKGEKKYGMQRTIPIPEPARAEVVSYLESRKNMLESKGIGECEPLIPRVTGEQTASYYSANHFQKLKRTVAVMSGIDFKLKDFRASYAQMLIDRKVSLQAVSKAMGHNTTVTTERYYARIRDVSMFREINSAWNAHADREVVEKRTKITRENKISGYA